MAEAADGKNTHNDAKCFTTMDAVPTYTGDDLTYTSTKWTQDLEDNAEIFGWSAQQKLIIARRSLKGTAELWLKTERTFKTYDELKAALLREFPEVIDSKRMHEIMSSRKKRAGETYYQYLLTMKELGKRAKFPDYVAVQYIIDGIMDTEINKIMFYGVTTYTLLKEKLSLYETFKEKSKKQELKSQRTIMKPTKVKEADGKTTQRCFKCGELGHLSSTCSHKIKCFRCNGYGHIGKDCTNVIQRDIPPSTSQKSTMGQRSMLIQQESSERTVNTEKSICDIASGERSDYLNVSQCGQCSHSQNINVLNVGKCSNLNQSVKSIQIKDITVDNCLIDTGSELNLLTLDLFSKLNVTKYDAEEMLMTGLGSCKVYSIGKFNIQMKIDGHSYDVMFYIVPTNVIPYTVILGQPFLMNTITVIDKGEIEVRPQFYDSSYLMCVLSSEEDIAISSEKPIVQDIIKNYRPIQTKEAPIKMKIILKDDIPVTQRPRRLALTEEEVVKHQIDEWLEKGIIRPSYSEYASPLVLVKKKDGTNRVCVDFRKINQKMVKDEYPLPIIDDQIDKLSKARVFSTIDLKNGFFHLPIEEDSIKYTAFVTNNPEGQYEFLRAPFGLSICPKYFTRFINIIFSDFIRKGIILIFIDDIIILAEDEDQAVQRLQDVLKVAAEYGLEINWKKTQILQQSVEYLGHIVSNGTVKPSSEKTNAVMRFPEPKSLKEVHSFIGLTSYFRKFIQDYATIAKPLSDLLKRGEFYFDQEQRCAFEKLKGKLCCEPVLKIFDVQLETELHTDASKHGYAGILIQKDPVDCSMHPVHYMSRKTTESQQKYSSYELEAMAVIEAVKKFRRYLIGIPFKIVTDCEAFQKTLYKKDVSAKVARWILFLQDFNYVIEHRKGDKMQHVDALSRNICVVNTELHARIKKAQDEDNSLKAIKEVLKKSEYEDYFLENDVIYKGVQKKLVLPEIMDLEMIRRVHGGGHFGKKKIKDIIERDYYINQLDSKTEKVISTCVPCLLASRKAGKKEGLLNPIEKGDLPLYTLHCDHLGPLDATKKLYNYILTVIDGYTKFVWIYPVKTVTAKETVDKIKQHQKDYGNPRRIITDRGTAFTGNEFQQYCLEEEIEHLTITTGIPRGNGQVERMNQIIISVLAKMCIEEPGHWYKYVSKLQRVINSTYQRSIKTSPFELLMGTKLRLNEDIKILEYLEEENIKEFTERREELRKQAKAQILKIQEENRKTYNKNRKDGEKYKIGDIVAIQRTQFGNTLKLKPKFYGPYKITKELGKDRYEVEKLDRSKEGPTKTTSGVDYMKRWP